MIRGSAPIIGLLAGVLLPATAYAQTNLDRGKSASQLFSSACIECHKAPHGLAKGKSTATVAEFLREHYTTNSEQAASLAAYIVAGRDTGGSPGPGRKPGERAGATSEEPKQDKHHAKPAEANAKPRDEVPSFMNPIVRPEPGVQEKPATATRNRRKEAAHCGAGTRTCRACARACPGCRRTTASRAAGDAEPGSCAVAHSGRTG